MEALKPTDPDALAVDMLRQLDAADKEEQAHKDQAEREAQALRAQESRRHQLAEAVELLELRQTALPGEIAKLEQNLTQISTTIENSLKKTCRPRIRQTRNNCYRKTEAGIAGGTKRSPSAP